MKKYPLRDSEISIVLEDFLLYAYTIKPPAMLVVPLTALALDKKTSNDIISVGPKPHYI